MASFCLQVWLVVGSLVQERDGHPGASPAKSQKDHEGLGASVIHGEAEKAGTMQP